MGHDKASIAESVWKTWSTRFLRKVLASTYSWRKQQDKSWVLWGFQKIDWPTFKQFKDILVECQLTLSWRSIFGFLTIGKKCLFHRGCSFSIQSFLENGLIPGGRGSDKGRQTVFFTPLNPYGGDSDEEEPRDDHTVPQKVHYHSHWERNQDAVNWRTIIPSTKVDDCNSGRRSHTQWMYTVLCQQIACAELFLTTEIEYCSKDARPLDLRQKSHSRAIGNRSSSTRYVKTWFAQENLRTTGREQGMSEATQQMIKLV